MSRPRYKIVVSDLHLGFGPFDSDGNQNILEDFFYDKPFAELLEYYSTGDYTKAEIELILNGDIFNHLHVYPYETNPSLFTERICYERTQKIIDGHPELFTALRRFAENDRHRLIYLMGNHDIGVAWPSVQQLLRDAIHPNIVIRLDYYRDGAVHVEHGNQFLLDNRMELEDLFLTRGEPEPVLKLPWGGLFVLQFINRVRFQRHYVGKVFPFRTFIRWSLLHDTLFALGLLAKVVLYFLKINFIRDPRRNFHFRDTWKIMTSYQFPQRLHKFAKKIFETNPEVRVVVFGHTHQALYQQLSRDRHYLNSGTWIELISLDLASLGRSLRWTFVEISYDKDGTPRPRLKEWKGTYRPVEEVVV